MCVFAREIIYHYFAYLIKFDLLGSKCILKRKSVSIYQAVCYGGGRAMRHNDISLIESMRSINSDCIVSNGTSRFHYIDQNFTAISVPNAELFAFFNNSCIVARTVCRKSICVQNNLDSICSHSSK